MAINVTSEIKIMMPFEATLIIMVFVLSVFLDPARQTDNAINIIFLKIG